MEQAVEHVTSSVTTGASVNVIAVGALAWFSNFGISSWSEFAALLACILTMTHLGILWWKIMWKPLFIKLGWLRKTRRKTDDNFL